CYLISAVMVHAVYSRFPRMRRSVLHYVLVTKNNEQTAELVLRAIAWYAWLRGKEAKISVIDEGSRDETKEILQRLDPDGNIQWIRVQNWIETDRVIRGFRKTARVAGYRGDGGSAVGQGLSGVSARSGRKTKMSAHATGRMQVNAPTEGITVIYLN